MAARLVATVGAMALLLRAAQAGADVPAVPDVVGEEVARVDVSAGPTPAAGGRRDVEWSSLATNDLAPGRVHVSFGARGGSALWVPVCAGRKAILVDGKAATTGEGPVVVDLPRDAAAHRVSIVVDVSGYEHRIACGGPPRLGARAEAPAGLVAIDFPSPSAPAGGGRAVLYVPPGHDAARPGALLVGLHPWNGGVWTYAAYEPLLAAARARDVVLLFPSGLGNSLYTEPAEAEVLRAIDAAARRLRVDPDRVTVWGASMGGAGATTIGFHHPDRFAGIVSLFGDSRYDLTTYVRAILHDGDGAHRVNALDVVDNARNVPVWLIHGEDDRTSPIAQSAILARAMTAKGFRVAFDHVPGAGHEGRVVSAFAARIVEQAAIARRVSAPARVSYWSVRRTDVGAYGIRLTRTADAGDAFFDVARDGGAVRVRAASGVRALRLPRGAFGLPPTDAPPPVVDAAAQGVDVAWDPLP